jgi:hypothetical protein
VTTVRRATSHDANALVDLAESVGREEGRWILGTGPWQAVATTSSETFRDRPPALGIYWYRVTPFAAGAGSGIPTRPVSNDDVSIRRVIGSNDGVIRPITGTIRPPPALQQGSVRLRC